MGKELSQLHAPASLRREEMSLLSKAEDAVKISAEMQAGGHQRKPHRKISALLQEKKQGSTAKVSAAEQLKEGVSMLHTYEKGMGKELRDERRLLKAVKSAKGEVTEALTEAHASTTVKSEIANLLAQAEASEKKEIRLEKKSLKDSKHEEAEFKADFQRKEKKHPARLQEKKQGSTAKGSAA